LDQLAINLLNGLGSGLLLFMLSSGLTLIFSMMGVLNFAHAGFYMLGAYVGYSVSRVLGFWPALVVAPAVVGLLGAAFERVCLRRVHRLGHVPELLVTFGFSYLILELVQVVWGRASLAFDPPALLARPAFTLVQSASHGLSWVLGRAPVEACAQAACTTFPATRAFMMAVALLMLLALWLLLRHTRVGLVIQAALTHPEMVEALGHDVPRVFMLVFGAGCALAGRRGGRRHRLAGGRVRRLAADRAVADAAADGGQVAGRRRGANGVGGICGRHVLSADEAHAGAGRAHPALPAAGADPDRAAARAVRHAR